MINIHDIMKYTYKKVPVLPLIKQDYTGHQETEIRL
jgi:hypothetical protein